MNTGNNYKEVLNAIRNSVFILEDKIENEYTKRMVDLVVAKGRLAEVNSKNSLATFMEDQKVNADK